VPALLSFANPVNEKAAGPRRRSPALAIITPVIAAYRLSVVLPHAPG